MKTSVSYLNISSYVKFFYSLKDVSDYSIVSTVAMLPLTNINGSHNGGRYFTTVLNDAGVEVIIRDLYFLPQFLEEPEDVLTAVNESVALSVVVDGSPFPSIQWQRLVDGVFQNQSDENSSVLQFPSIKHADAGVYRCVILSTINGTDYSDESREVTVSGWLY